MKTEEEEYEKDFVQYTDKELVNSKNFAKDQLNKKDKEFDQAYANYKQRKEQLTDDQISRFKGYNEIVGAFDFGDDFTKRLDQELSTVITGFENKVSVPIEEIEKERKRQKEIDREKKFEEKINLEAELQNKTIDEGDNESSILSQEKVRQSLISEIELDVKQTAIKKVLNNQDFDTYKKINLGMIQAELGKLLFSFQILIIII